MNCSNLVEATGWVCAPTGRNAFLAYAPVSLGDDGQLASFYILNTSSDTFFLTDAHAAIMHAAEHGCKLNKARIKQVARTPGLRYAQIGEDGEITASGDLKNLKASLWDALRAMLAITNNELTWAPRIHQERFTSKVGSTLRKNPTLEILSKPRLTGASGRQIEFPLGILVGDSFVRVIQTIGITATGQLDWNYIYQSFGKLNDLKNASSRTADNRLVVIEQGADRDEFAKAVTVLSETAKVIEYSDNNKFIASVAA